MVGNLENISLVFKQNFLKCINLPIKRLVTEARGEAADGKARNQNPNPTIIVPDIVENQV